jgi:hypothetical protein
MHIKAKSRVNSSIQCLLCVSSYRVHSAKQACVFMRSSECATHGSSHRPPMTSTVHYTDVLVQAVLKDVQPCDWPDFIKKLVTSYAAQAAATEANEVEGSKSEHEQTGGVSTDTEKVPRSHEELRTLALTEVSVSIGSAEAEMKKLEGMWLLSEKEVKDLRQKLEDKKETSAIDRLHRACEVFSW